MDRKVVGVVLFGVVAVVTSPTTDENGVVWCSCSCSLSTICLSVYLSSICLSVCLSIHLPVCLSICPSASLKTKLFCKSSWIFEFDNINRQQVCETSWAFELDNVTTSKTQQLCETSWVFELDNVATSKTQQVCEISWVFELDNVTTSKTQQFCEASSIFEVDNIKTKAIRRDFLQNWKVECRADGLVVPMRFAIFPFHLFKVLRVPWKSEARSYEVLHLSRKIILANLKIRCSKMQHPLRKSAPWPPNIWWACLLYCACHRKCIFADPLQMSHACQRFWNCYKTITVCSLLARCRILCASDNKDASTSKNGPSMSCF